MLRFKIQIANGSLIDINEPIGFDKVDFNLTRSESLYSVSSSFAGNNIEFEFRHDVHYNVFESIVNDYEQKGFNAVIKLFIEWNDTNVFTGEFDLSTAQTDLVNYLKCTIIKKDKLYYLDKNKSVSVDLLSNKKIDKTNDTVVPLSDLYMYPITLSRESIWEDKERTIYFMYPANLSTVFNNCRTLIQDQIPNGLSWLSIMEYTTESRGRHMQLVSAKENLKNINIKLDFDSQNTISKMSTGTTTCRLYLYYGDEQLNVGDLDWVNGVERVLLYTVTLTGGVSANLPSTLTYNIPALNRGSGIWLFWYCESGDGGNGVVYENYNTKYTIKADTTTYGSALKGVTYKDLVKNAVSKVASIQNVQWNVNYYDKTMAFNGNLLRQINNEGFNIKWQDIQKQLDERCLGAYYNEITDTLVIDSRDNIFGNNEIMAIGDLASKDNFNVGEDEKFIINQFNYKYNKYQAQKENEVNGNRSSIHGESEWYVKNKSFDNTLTVDLPFVRDSFMIEDIRRKSIEYKEDTATNEDDTIVLIETEPFSGSMIISETMYLNASFQDGVQSLSNNSSFSWKKLGLRPTLLFTIDGEEYNVLEVGDTIIQLTRSFGNTSEFNGVRNYGISYIVNQGSYSTTSQGLFNTSFSIRQNIQYWRSTLRIPVSYLVNPITNTLYKENKDFTLNGLKETDDILTTTEVHTPRTIDTKVIISIDEYFYLQNNRIGYIRVYDAKDNPIRVYINELQAVFLDGCDRMQLTINGWLKKNDFILYVSNDLINNIAYENMVIIANDEKQTFDFIDNKGYFIYRDVTYTRIAHTPLTYESVKSFLLSL